MFCKLSNHYNVKQQSFIILFTLTMLDLYLIIVIFISVLIILVAFPSIYSFVSDDGFEIMESNNDTTIFGLVTRDCNGPCPCVESIGNELMIN